MMCAARDLMKCSADNDAGKSLRAGPNWNFLLYPNVPLEAYSLLIRRPWNRIFPTGSSFSWSFNPLPRHARFVAQVRVGAEIVIPEKISLYVVYKPKVKKFDFN